MALQFQPPPDWLVNDYLKRQNPLQQINETVGGALQTYADYATKKTQLDQQKKEKAASNLLAMLSTDPELMKTPYGKQLMAQSGVDLSGYTPPGVSSGTTPSATVPPVPETPATAGLPPPGSSPGSSPVIDHWNQNVAPTLGMQNPTMATTTTPASGNPPPQFPQLVTGRGKLGDKANAEILQNLTAQEKYKRLTTDKPTDKFYTHAQAKGLLKNNPDAAEILGAFPKDQVPRDAVHLAMSASSQNRTMGNTVWDTATPGMRATAKALYEGRVRPSDVSFRERGVITQLAQEYADRNGLAPFKAYAGDVNAAMAKYSTTGKMGQNATSLNTALGHANSALDAYQAVENTDKRFLNVPINKLRAQTNDPNIIKLQTTLNALSGELATTFKNSSGTDQEIGHWMNVLSQDLTPKQAVGVIQQVNDLLRSRLDALEYQRGSAGGGTGQSLLSPHGEEISKRLQGVQSQASKSFIKPGEEAEYEAYKRQMMGGR